jgi:hypothetical protein
MVATSRYTALIAMRVKRGECEAVQNGTPELWQRVQPLIDLDDRSSAATQLARVEEIARRLARFDRHLMVDVSDVHTPSNFGPAGPLGALVDRLADQADLFDDTSPVPVIPVIRDNASDAVATSVARLADETGIGMALRIHAAGTNPAAVAHLVRTMMVDSRDLDVIIDQRYVDRVRPELTELVLRVLDTVNAIGPVRSVALLSGSVPKTLDRTSLWEQPRYEELLWREISTRSDQQLQVGDYGVVHPIPGEGFRSKHVSIKYSSGTAWLFCRERMVDATHLDDSVENGRARTFRLASRRLVDDEHFAGPLFSWGDDQLVLAAHGSGGSGLGSTSKPVAVATSHHLAYLAAQHAAA